MWAYFGSDIGGDGTKFADYFCSAGIHPYHALMMKDEEQFDVKTLLDIEIPPPPNLSRMRKELMDCCPLPKG